MSEDKRSVPEGIGGIGNAAYWDAMLSWNRSQSEPPIKVGSEYAVAQQAEQLLAASQGERTESAGRATTPSGGQEKTDSKPSPRNAESATCVPESDLPAPADQNAERQRSELLRNLRDKIDAVGKAHGAPSGETPEVEEAVYIVPEYDDLRVVEGLREVVSAGFARDLARKLSEAREELARLKGGPIAEGSTGDWYSLCSCGKSSRNGALVECDKDNCPLPRAAQPADSKDGAREELARLKGGKE